MKHSTFTKSVATNHKSRYCENHQTLNKLKTHSVHQVPVHAPYIQLPSLLMILYYSHQLCLRQPTPGILLLHGSRTQQLHIAHHDQIVWHVWKMSGHPPIFPVYSSSSLIRILHKHKKGGGKKIVLFITDAQF